MSDSDDVAARLRDWGSLTDVALWETCDEAADEIVRLREALERAATHIQILHRGLSKAGWGDGASAAYSEIEAADRAFSENKTLWGDLRDVARGDRK